MVRFCDEMRSSIITLYTSEAQNKKTISMKTKARNLNWFVPKSDDYGKRLKDCDLRIGTWNVRPLERVDVSAHLADAFIKSWAGITAIQEIE